MSPFSSFQPSTTGFIAGVVSGLVEGSRVVPGLFSLECGAMVLGGALGLLFWAWWRQRARTEQEPQGEPYTEYTIPAKMTGWLFESEGYKAAERTFGIRRISDEQQKSVATMNPESPFGAQYEAFIICSISHIGGNPVGDKNTAARWWRAIGPQARKIVEMAYEKAHTT